MSEHIFIYGTLLPNHAPDEIQSAVQSLRYVGDGCVRGWLYDVGDFPALVLNPNAPKAFGKVFAFASHGDLLQQFDSYEEFHAENVEASLFVRQQTMVTLTDGSKVPCWIYVYNRAIGNAKLISSGHYFEDKTVKK